MISIDDFAKVEMKVGTVIESKAVEGSEKLVQLIVDLGEEKPRTVLTGMRKWYEPEYFLNRQIVIVANLEPRPMMGLVSEGMIVACDLGDPESEDNKPVLLLPSEKVSNGSKIR
jgi:methionyl-tRNA synthetase